MRALSGYLLLAAATACVVGLGCGRTSRVRIAHDDDAPIAASRSSAELHRRECPIAGRMTVGAGTGLSALRDDATPFGTFVSGAVALETTDVPAIGGARVRTLATVKGGVSLEGWMDGTNLDVEVARVVELAGKTAYVPRGTRVSIVVGAGTSVVVSPWTRDLPRFDVTVRCDALAIGPVPDHDEPAFVAVASSSASPTEKTLALVHDALPVAATPGGAPIFTLHGGVGLHVKVSETKEGLHVHYEDGIVVDGWVRAQDVEVPKTYRTHAIGCGMGISMGTGMPGRVSLGVAKKETPIFVGENAGGTAKGSIAAGGRVLVVDVDAGYAQILTECGEIVPAGKQRFWVEAAALEIGEKVPPATLRTKCK